MAPTLTYLIELKDHGVYGFFSDKKTNTKNAMIKRSEIIDTLRKELHSETFKILARTTPIHFTRDCILTSQECCFFSFSIWLRKV